MELVAFKSCGRKVDWPYAEGGATPRRVGVIVLVLLPAEEAPAAAALDRLAHEYSLKDELGSTWAVRPLELFGTAAKPL